MKKTLVSARRRKASHSKLCFEGKLPDGDAEREVLQRS